MESVCEISSSNVIGNKISDNNTREDLMEQINRNKDIVVDLERTSPHVCFCLIEYNLDWFPLAS